MIFPDRGPPQYNSGSRFPLGCILGIALVLRILLPLLGYLFTHDRTIFYAGDSEQYLVPANELIASHRFFSDGSRPARAWNWPIIPAPEVLRTPGYPLLLAVGLLSGHVEATTIACQILLSCLTVYVVYLTAGLLFENEWTALAAGALYAAEPSAILFSSLISSEALFTSIFMIGIYYLAKYMRRGALTNLGIAGGALGVSEYVRPAGYFLPLIIAIAMVAWAFAAGCKHKHRVVAQFSAFVLIPFVLVVPWRIRNKIETGYSGFSSIFTQDMYCNVAASVVAAQRHMSYREMQDRMGCYDLAVYFEDHPGQIHWSLRRILDYQCDRTVRIFLLDPVTFAKIYLAGVVRGVFDPLSTEYVRFFDLYPKQGGLLETAVDQGVVKTLQAMFRNKLLAWSTMILLLIHFVYLSGASIGLCKSSMRDPAVLLMIVAVGYYLALPGGPSDWGRYRHPAMPLICVFAGYGVRLAGERISSHRGKTATPMRRPLSGAEQSCQSPIGL